MIAPYRVVLSESATSVMRSLSSKTGLSANIIARFAMLISFEDSDPPAVDTGKPALTINRATLFGELEPFLMSAYALSVKSSQSGSPSRDLANHIARGAAYLNVRSQSLTDVLEIINDLS